MAKCARCGSLKLTERPCPRCGGNEVGPPAHGMADGSDPHVSFNMRDWLKAAVEAKGARMIGGGIGCGGADIDVLLDGCKFNITIKPI